jgi:hypothetical protein
VRVGKGAFGGVDVDHRHVSGSVLECPAKCLAVADRRAVGFLKMTPIIQIAG